METIDFPQFFFSFMKLLSFFGHLKECILSRIIFGPLLCRYYLHVIGTETSMAPICRLAEED